MDILTEKQRTTAKHLIEKQIAKHLTDLPQMVANVLYQATLNALGVRDSSDGLRFRNSIGSDWLSKEIKRRIEAAVSEQTREVVVTALKQAAQDHALHTAIHDEIYAMYKSAFIDTVGTQIKARAQEDARKAVERLTRHISFNPLQDPADPKSYNSPLGEIVLQKLAKEISEEKWEEDEEDEASCTASASPSPGPDDDIPF